MKKKALSILLALTMSAVVVSGCSQKTADSTTVTTEKTEEPESEETEESSEQKQETASSSESENKTNKNKKKKKTGNTSETNKQDNQNEQEEQDQEQEDTQDEEDEDDEQTDESDEDVEQGEEPPELIPSRTIPEDGVYSAKFTTDSSMFHVNEAYDDRGTLTVAGGKMTLHITMPSKNIVNLFYGKADDAMKDGAELIEPTTDTVTYEDGTTEEVYGFDVPVPAIDEFFDLALIGTKGKWYDHQVIVSEVKKLPDKEETPAAAETPAATETSETAETSDTTETPDAAEASAASGTSTAGEPSEVADASGEDDLTAAKKVAELIDAIYVQQWTEDTYSQCEEAKKAWDALTDAQKELVEGEEADPEYFGRDTGDASKDDPLNGDGIGENELLVVSFGTSFNDSRADDIGGIEKALAAAYPDWSVRRAFTAQIIINHVYARDGEKIDNVQQALQRAVDNGVKNLVVQPTHLMHGAEYDELCEALDGFKDKFESVKVAEPLLGEVGADASVINEDKEKVAAAITAEAVADAGYDSVQAAADDGTAFVFMGHGTSHTANVSYSQMQTQMDKLGYANVFIGTVEGLPESTELSNVIEAVKDAGYKKVILRPLMVVAGDHANNDMAGDDEDSWKSGFESSGYFDSVECQIAGLGRIEDVQKIYVEHTGLMLEK